MTTHTLNVLHVCTTEDFRAGMEDIPPLECWLCGHETMIADWGGGRCDTCGANMDDPTWSVHRARDKAKIPRRDFAQHIGVSPATVKKYEWCGASMAYIKRCRRFFRRYYQEDTCTP